MEEIKQSNFYSVLADEVTSHNIEHLALCARFVDQDKNVREEFLAFLPLQRITGQYIADEIISFLSSKAIPLANIRGQGYDGAANMASNRVGEQKRIKEISPLATYVHCSGHCLNLVITKCCSIPDVRNVIDRLQHCCRFFLNSPKHSGLLELIVTAKVQNSVKRKPLLDLCKTRWAERHSAYQHFYQAFIYTVEALEVIGYKRHLDKYGDVYSDWDPANRTEAQQLVASITAFTFIIGFMTVYQYLSHLAGITCKLQQEACDIVEAHKLIATVTATYKDERNNVDSAFTSIFDQSERMADAVGTSAVMPRIAAQQLYRSNPESSGPLLYFKRSLAIPYLDHIISSLESQFSESAIIASTLLCNVPSICCSEDVSFDAVLSTHKEDLPSPELFPMELKRWKSKYMGLPARQRPSSPAQSIKDCDKDLFPNIYILH